MYFLVKTPCGQSWPGMIGTQDAQIVLSRAMKHVKECKDCGTDMERPA